MYFLTSHHIRAKHLFSRPYQAKMDLDHSNIIKFTDRDFTVKTNFYPIINRFEPNEKLVAGIFSRHEKILDLFERVVSHHRAGCLFSGIKYLS
jgi:hypothetical protein